MMNYHLKNKKSAEVTQINLCVRIDGRMFKYSTGKKVNPKNWDFESKRVLKGHPNHVALNEYLKKLHVKFDSLVMDSQTKGSVCFETLRNDLDTFRGKKKKVTEKPVEEKLQFQELWTNKWLDSLKPNCAYSTIKKKQYILQSLMQFQKETHYKLTLDNVNDVFAEKFKKWALKAKLKNGKSRFNRDNTIHKYLSITKEFMKWCNKRGFTTNRDYTNISSCKEFYFTPFALEGEDISKLLALDFNTIDLISYGVRPCNVAKTKTALETARDSFVFRCFCGIRFSDYHSLAPNKFKGNRLSLVTQKTATNVAITLPESAFKILLKYDYKLPKLANQEENEQLKLLSKIAGFNEETTITYKRAGDQVSEVKQRWELVTSHTARKTFITNCLRAGIDAYLVMEIVGIKKESTFRRYIQVTKNDVAGALDKLEKHYAM
jgi:site-specific recombinase XerD